jgi:hypothetical protein
VKDQGPTHNRTRVGLSSLGSSHLRVHGVDELGSDRHGHRREPGDLDRHVTEERIGPTLNTVRERVTTEVRYRGRRCPAWVSAFLSASKPGLASSVST